MRVCVDAGLFTEVIILTGVGMWSNLGDVRDK